MNEEGQVAQKDNKKRVINPDTSNSFQILILSFAVILCAIGTFYIYYEFLKTPELPEIDLNEYWGPYPIDPKADSSVRPFQIEFSDVVVNDLKERLLHRRPFTPPLLGAGFTYGFNTDFLTKVLDFWQNKYNFGEREKFLNKYNHFITKIQGLDIHFMHVKPKVTSDIEVVPILLLHGWPGSVREFYEIIPQLTTPRAGYKFVFEVIAPSLPGYGFSEGATRPGFSVTEIAVVFRNLMNRLGFERYYVQGGDWGHVIGSRMATFFPGNVIGFHTNMPIVSINDVWPLMYTIAGSFWPSLMVEPEVRDRIYPLDNQFRVAMEETGYLHLQATKPDTIGVALTDSPAGLAAYILEKFSTWTKNSNKRASDGNLLDRFTLTALLDNVMIYWVTNSITTSMRLYAESMSSREALRKLDTVPTFVPTWGIKFKHEIAVQSDTILKVKYKNYLHSTVVDAGGHFAAMEVPDILTDDIFEAIQTFIEFHNRGNSNKQIPAEYETAKSIYEFTVRDIKAEEVKLDRYKGHVAIIVNVASQCGYTQTHYKELNELYEKYSDTKGLRILAFPCNQFAGQEPGSAKDILTFTKDRGVRFDLFEKVEVNGDNAHPLFKFLKRSQSGTLGDFIKWNFSKFIVDKNGVPVERFGPNVNPLELEPILAKYW